MHKRNGFTLVELLIVIVVIAILAAVTIVAYNGVQNRANDTTVQSDIRNFANLIMQYNAINGEYPSPKTLNTDVPNNDGLGKTKPVGTDNFYVSKGAYATDVHNFVYCEQDDASGNPTFAVAAKSKSGTFYVYHANGGLEKYTGAWGGMAQICPGLLGIPIPESGFYYAYGYNGSDHKWWHGWTQ